MQLATKLGASSIVSTSTIAYCEFSLPKTQTSFFDESYFVCIKIVPQIKNLSFMEGGSDDSFYGNFENNPNFWLEPSYDPLATLDSFSWPLDNFSHQQNLFNTVTNDYNPDVYSGFSTGSSSTNNYTEGVSELNIPPQEIGLLNDTLLVDGVTDQNENLDSNFNAFVEAQLQERPNIRIERIEKNGSSMYWIKGQWTVEEDRKLINLVNQYGYRKWATIAEHMVGRIGKQCRERWHNHLRPDIKKDLVWSEDEERLLIEAHERLGNKWAEIAKYIPGRTENSIKNHWNATKRKQTSKRKIKRPDRLKGLVLSTVLEDYIKNKYFNKGSTSSNIDVLTTPNANLQPIVRKNSVIGINPPPSSPDDSTSHFNFDTFDEEMNFIDVLFGHNANVNGKLMSSTNINASEDNMEQIGSNGDIPRVHDQAQDDFFSPDIFFSDYMFEGSPNNMDSNLE